MSRVSQMPELFQTEAHALLHKLLPAADADITAACMHEIARHFSPALNLSAFRIISKSAILAVIQRSAACSAVNDPVKLRKHAAVTLQRCLPYFADDNLLDRCMETLQTASDNNDPMLTGAILQFAASELLAIQDDSPYLTRLHQAALRYLPLTRPVDRDDLRLIALAALYEPGKLPSGQYTAIIQHRLGLDGPPHHSCEEVAAMMHLPLTTVHETETAALSLLADRHADRSDSNA